ncbi:Putative WEB family protein [Apostasia shenzhenica]|uniref:WEB family protein n=1 Tax=Apostasia shenzhenica TaxID=1088818 RepID=A0A2I0A5H0_9ASPA|nr:Putative WEB family protein [Apostasia shenzhenica]
MHAFKSSLRSHSSDVQQKSSRSSSSCLKGSSSPKITGSSSVSSPSVDSKPNRVLERRPSSSQEKQRTMRVSEMQQQLGQLQEELKRAKEERTRALEETAELKKISEGPSQNRDEIRILKEEAENAKESERKMLESLISQTKQLEQTKISLEEARLEIRNHQDSIRMMENSARLSVHNLQKNGSTSSIGTLEEIRKLRHELWLALEAEEKSKKAMDDFAVALKEVTTVANQAKAELAARHSELENARSEAVHASSDLHSTEKKLQEVSEDYEKLKLEYEESCTAWKAKEESLMNCMKISEEDMIKKEEECNKLADVQKLAREENSKLRDIIKQAVNESTVIKESLEIARSENYELKEQLSKKEKALQQIMQDYESLKVSESAALDSLRELKSLLSLTSVADSKKASNLPYLESHKQSKPAVDDSRESKNAEKFTPGSWMLDNHCAQNGRRHSVAESGNFRGLTNKNHNAFGVPLTSSLLSDDKGLNAGELAHLEGTMRNEADNEKQQKKKTVLGRFGDALRRTSFRK